MKRVLCVLLILSLAVPVLLVSASAAEEYVFEWVNPEAVVLDDSYEMLPLSEYFFAYDGVIPDGYYTLCMFYSEDSSFFLTVSEPFYFVYSPDDEDILAIPVCLEAYGGDDITDVTYCDLLFGSFGTAVICAFGLNGSFLEIDSSLTLVLTSYSVVPSLSDYVSSDLFLGFMDEIIAILPVCVVAIVGYIGTRKGIAWIRDQLYGA